jgi:hypothetical protein
MLSEVEAFRDFFSDEEISSSLQRSNAQRPTLNVQIDLPAEGLEPTRPCGHWILSPARLPIPPRRRGQEHTHFARLDEHFDWPGTQAASPLLHSDPELFPLLLKRKESRHITVIGKAFGMSGARPKLNQTADRGCPSMPFWEIHPVMAIHVD